MMMQGVGDELLPGPRFSPDQHGGVGADDLSHLLIDPAHRATVAHDVGKFVALAELLAELGVFLHQALALQIHQPLDPEGLRNHSGRNPQDLDHPVPVPLTAKGEFDRERPLDDAIGNDRDTDEGGLLPPHIRTGSPMEEARLAAHPRNYRRRPALGYHAGDPFAQAIAHPLALTRVPQRRLYCQNAGALVAQGHRSADSPTAPPQDLQHAVEPGLEVEGAGEGLSHFYDGAQLAQVAVVGGSIRGRRTRPGGPRAASVMASCLRPVREQRGNMEDDFAGGGGHESSRWGKTAWVPVSTVTRAMHIMQCS